jgi:phytoene dehydrogenase-like protein
MAGYIVTQVFDKHIPEPGYPEILSLFSEYLRSRNGKVLLQDKIEKITLWGKDKESCFEIRTSKNTFFAKWIVSTYDENLTYESYFPDLPAQKIKIDKLTPVSVTSVRLKKPEWLGNDISLKYFSGESPENVLHNLENEDINTYKISFYSIRHDLFVQGEFSPGAPVQFRKSKILEYLRNLIHDLEFAPKDLQWFYPEDIEKVYGYSYGFPHRWAFRANETPVNPFDRTTGIKNLLCTGCWGTAWFTAAIGTSRFIQQKNRTI